MPEPATKSELLLSLGRLTRGLSALFWGLPAALITSVQAGTNAWFGLPASLSLVGPIAAFALLLYGLQLMAGFQRQERVWIAALDQACILSLACLGLSPFLYWHQRLPQAPLFGSAVLLLAAFSLCLLLALNRVLRRLSALLPDETLRHETNAFTVANSWMCLLLPALGAAWAAAIRHASALPVFVRQTLQWTEPVHLLVLGFLALLPISITMSLVWKTKEAILDCVFSQNPAPPPSAPTPPTSGG